MTNKVKALILLAVALGSYAFGRFSVPEKIKVIEVEKTVTKEKTDRKKEVNRKITKRKITRPDGTVEEISRIVDKSKDTTKKDSSITNDKTKESETAKSSSKLTVDVLTGVSFTQPSFVYGLSIGRDMVGPVRMGAWALTSGHIGLSLGLSF